MDDFNAYIISLLDEDHEEPEFDLEKQRLDLEKQRLDLQDKEPLGDRECKTSEKQQGSKQLMEILKHQQEDDDAVD